MADLHVEHVFDCDEDTFWKLFFDADFNIEMFRDNLRFSKYERTAFEETDSTIKQTLVMAPPVENLPSALKTVVGDSIQYEEIGEFDKASKRYTMTVKPGTMADRIDVKATITTAPTDAGPDGKARCRRILDASVKARITFVGGMLEKKILGDVGSNYEASHAFTNKYLAR